MYSKYVRPSHLQHSLKPRIIHKPAGTNLPLFPCLLLTSLLVFPNQKKFRYISTHFREKNLKRDYKEGGGNWKRPMLIWSFGSFKSGLNSKKWVFADFWFWECLCSYFLAKSFCLFFCTIFFILFLCTVATKNAAKIHLYNSIFSE